MQSSRQPDQAQVTFPLVGRRGSRYVTGQEIVVDGGLTINGNVGHTRDET